MTSRSLIVFLHGSGSTGLEVSHFLSLVPLGAARDFLPFRDLVARHNMEIVTPTASKRPYSPNFGQDSTVWFNRAADFLSHGRDDGYEDVEGADLSLLQVAMIIDEKEKDFDHIFFGGISMGGCCALHGLRKHLHNKVRGLFSMGSFLVNNSAVCKQDSPALPELSAQLPVLMMHGRADSMIRHEWGQETATSLILRGVNVQFESYDGLDHEIGEGELVDLLAWMLDLRDSADKALSSIPVSDPEEKDAKAWVEVEAASIGAAALPPPPSGFASSGIEYTIQVDPQRANEATIRFPIPVDVAEQLIPLLTARPILASGGSFDIVRDPNNCGVLTTVQSSNPEKLAKEIGARLAIRITSGGSSLDACPMS